MQAMKIFLSYYEQEEPLARALDELLSNVFEDGVRVDYFGKGGRAGGDWMAWINAQVAEADVALVVMTRESMARPWVQWEWGAVHGFMLKKENKKVIPVSFDTELGLVGGPIARLQGADGTSKKHVFTEIVEWIARTRNAGIAGVKSQFNEHWDSYFSAVTNFNKPQPPYEMKLLDTVNANSLWLDLLRESDDSENLDLLGVSLVSWLRTPGFEDVLLEKAAAKTEASETSKIRLLNLSAAHPAVGKLDELGGTGPKLLADDIRSAGSLLHSIAQRSDRIEFNQLHELVPNCAITLNGHRAVMYPYLRHIDVNKASGPLIKIHKNHESYEILTAEFDDLWVNSNPYQV